MDENLKSGIADDRTTVLRWINELEKFTTTRQSVSNPMQE